MESKVMQVIPYRMMLHSLPPSHAHIDIFLGLPGEAFLYAYECQEECKKALLPCPETQNATVCLLGFAVDHPKDMPKKDALDFLIETFSKRAKKTFIRKESCLARRKRDHRLRYWQYQGPISHGRGHIEELQRGDFFTACSYNCAFRAGDYFHIIPMLYVAS